MSDCSRKKKKRKLIRLESDRPSGTDEEGKNYGSIQKVADNKWKIVLELPNQSTFYCPICNCSYNIYSSIIQHLTLKHEAAEVEYLFKCCECEQVFESRKKLGQHASNDHAAKGPPAIRKGTFHCSFCDEPFATQRGQAQHERNKHSIRDCQSSYQMTMKRNKWRPSVQVTL